MSDESVMPHSAPALPDDVWGTACTLDHDGCVVCADAGIPVRVLTVDGDDALCQDSAGNRATIAVELVAPVRGGDVLLTHGGVAIGRVAGIEQGVERPRGGRGEEGVDEVRR